MDPELFEAEDLLNIEEEFDISSKTKKHESKQNIDSLDEYRYDSSAIEGVDKYSVFSFIKRILIKIIDFVIYCVLDIYNTNDVNDFLKINKIFSIVVVIIIINYTLSTYNFVITAVNELYKLKI